MLGAARLEGEVAGWCIQGAVQHAPSEMKVNASSYYMKNAVAMEKKILFQATVNG